MTFEYDLVFVQARIITSAKSGKDFAVVKVANPRTYESFEVFAESVDYIRSLALAPGTPVKAEFVVRGGSRTTLALRRLTV